MKYTLEEYWALEAQSETRYEYLNGQVWAKEYDGVLHNLLTNNVMLLLRPAVKQSGGRVFKENVRLAVVEGEWYAYPDIAVVCDPADRLDLYTIHNPVLLAEVLSPSTSEYDYTTKFENYQKIPGLRHYVLISQAAWIVEWFRRDEAGQWIYTLLTGPDSTLKIPDMGLVLPLRELYEDTGIAPLRVLPSAEEGGMSPLESEQE